MHSIQDAFISQCRHLPAASLQLLRLVLQLPILALQQWHILQQVVTTNIFMQRILAELSIR